jgi:hypothetical protein
MATKNSWNSNVPVEIAKGGTNATTMATSTGIVKYDGTSLVTSSTAKIDSSNRYTNTGQPAFHAFLGSQIDNVTGAGTDYSIVFDDELFDYCANFNTATGIFTAPVDGVFLLTAKVLLVNVLMACTFFTLRIKTTSKEYKTAEGRVATDVNWGKNFSVIASMSKDDTAYCIVSAGVGAGDTVDVYDEYYSSSLSGVLLT